MSRTELTIIICISLTIIFQFVTGWVYDSITTNMLYIGGGSTFNATAINNGGMISTLQNVKNMISTLQNAKIVVQAILLIACGVFVLKSILGSDYPGYNTDVTHTPSPSASQTTHNQSETGQQPAVHTAQTQPPAEFTGSQVKPPTETEKKTQEEIIDELQREELQNDPDYLEIG